MRLLSNPEFVRNARGQLRAGKLMAAAVICAVISMAVALSFWQRHEAARGPNDWGISLLKVTLFVQALVLAAGGGIACVNSIHREKEQNTFDFQRVTRLTPAELTLGKLFGAPVLSYFVFLCFMPLAIFAAEVGRPRFSFLMAAYVVMVAGSLAFQALALLISLLTGRGSHSSAMLILLLLLASGVSSVADGSSLGFRLGSLSPFFAATLPEERSWGAALPAASPRYSYQSHNDADQLTDVFFGYRINHIPVCITLNAILTFWFLLAVVRNIKRDPNYYEVYSPPQAVGFAIFLNLVFVGFFAWKSATPIEGQAYLLTLNMIVFFCLGLALLRNRERLRRGLRSGDISHGSWLGFSWPAPLLVLGAVVATAMIVVGIAKAHEANVYWSPGFAAFRSLFFIVWVVRDIQYLQWMSLRRGKHSLVMGVLYLLIFYACTTALLAAFGVLQEPERAPFAAFFLPTPVYILDHSAWVMRPAMWVAAFVTQWVLACVFMALQKQVVDELAHQATQPLQVTAT